MLTTYRPKPDVPCAQHSTAFCDPKLYIHRPADKDAEAPSFSEGKQQPLLNPFKMGDFQLSTRMVYAPLTRCRALGTIPQVLRYELRESDCMRVSTCCKQHLDWSAALAMWQCTHSMCTDSVQPAAAEYYTQRAFKGSFQLSEGTVVSPYGHGCAAADFVMH